MTKPVTSVAAMTVVEDGKIELDAAVSRYLPELAGMQVATEVADPTTGRTKLALAQQMRPMTLRDLLRHTSGLVYPPQYIDSTLHRLYGSAVFTRDTTLADFVVSLGKLPLAHQPGEVWEYSWGVDVLARIVEVGSGQPFDEYLQARLFGPLHMVDTGFYVPEAKLGRLVDPAPEGRPALWDVSKPARLFSGGGGLVSTATDYLRFCQMLLGRGELAGVRVLSPETVKLMTMNSLSPGVRFAQDMIGPAAGATLGARIRDSNWRWIERSAWIDRQLRLGRSLGHLFFWVDPVEKLIAVQMIQVNPEESAPYRALGDLTYDALCRRYQDAH